MPSSSPVGLLVIFHTVHGKDGRRGVRLGEREQIQIQIGHFGSLSAVLAQGLVGMEQSN